MTDTRKALLIRRDIMDPWMEQVQTGQMPDHGLEFSQELTDEHPDSYVVYLVPADRVDDVIRDADTMLARFG